MATRPAPTAWGFSTGPRENNNLPAYPCLGLLPSPRARDSTRAANPHVKETRQAGGEDERELCPAHHSTSQHRTDGGGGRDSQQRPPRENATSFLVFSAPVPSAPLLFLLRLYTRFLSRLPHPTVAPRRALRFRRPAPCSTPRFQNKPPLSSDKNDTTFQLPSVGFFSSFSLPFAWFRFGCPSPLAPPPLVSVVPGPLLATGSAAPREPNFPTSRPPDRSSTTNVRRRPLINPRRFYVDSGIFSLSLSASPSLRLPLCHLFVSQPDGQPACLRCALVLPLDSRNPLRPKQTHTRMKRGAC